MRKIAVVLCALLLLLSACTSDVPPETTGAPPIQPTAIPTESTSVTAPSAQPTEPSILPTEPSVQPTEPQENKLEKFQTMFCGGREWLYWYNRALTCTYDTVEQLDLIAILNGYDKRVDAYADEELNLLLTYPGFQNSGIRYRYCARELNSVLSQYFGIGLDDLPAEVTDKLIYLETTDSYYFTTNSHISAQITATAVETLDDGTNRMTYLRDGQEYIVSFRPNGDYYQILSNVAVNPALVQMQSIFRDYDSWYNRALTCTYSTPQELNLHQFFLCGFDDESGTLTDEERSQLRERGFSEWQDIFRLPVEKMNAVLTEYFGITLDQVESSGFNGLEYLESTDCYYFMTGDSNWADITVTALEDQPDGTILMRYTTNRGSFIVTLLPNEDGYMILSNLPQTVTPEPADEDFVRVGDYIPDIVVELKYATADNFTGQVIYDFSDAYLRYGTVKKLMNVQQALREQGLSLKIWDGFRPPAAQFRLWEICPDPTYVADPNNG